ncbi:hypothetical protein PCANB_003072 [Pneumocystis canis]|nr:hypothetical protein PCANB_003072 [Pneumocystis canis]
MIRFIKLPEKLENLGKSHIDNDENEDFQELLYDTSRIHSFSGSKIVTPGEFITDDPQFMRGHGTYIDNENAVYASVTGTVQRVNKLISVKPSRSRYLPEIGDLIVGRISEVGHKRWKVDIGSKQDAVLMLSSINLPGGILRRKSETDELKMRTFFSEGDLLVAEVQTFFSDGSVSLHTRSLKYGKLRNGLFVQVPSNLIVRSNIHSYNLPNGTDVILGTNGYIWVSKHVEISSEKSGVSITRMEEEASETIYSNINDNIEPYLLREISRVHNVIKALAACKITINEKMILLGYEASMIYEDAAQLLWPSVQHFEMEKIESLDNLIQNGAWKLLETILYDGNDFFLLEKHIQRLIKTSKNFNWKIIDTEIIKKKLRDSVDKCGSSRVHLTVARDGTIDIQVSPFTLPKNLFGVFSGKKQEETRLWKVYLDTVPVDDTFRPFFCHKTTYRDPYEASRKRLKIEGEMEVLLYNKSGYIMEGSICNVAFFRDHQWITPSLKEGCLPGIMRETLLQKGYIIERSIQVCELMNGERLLLFNSLRGCFEGILC